MKTILIVNARIVNEGTTQEGDVYIRKGRIEQIGPDLAGRTADTVIDADGQVLLPGLIDDQVHFREPGATHKGDLASESAAAVAGGITSYMDMPNTQPSTITSKLLEEKFDAAGGRSFANYTFYLGATNDNIEEIKSFDPLSACGIKVFMGASTGDLLVDDHKALEEIFEHAATIVATHCEDNATIAANTERLRSIYGDEIPVSKHPEIRSDEACYMSTSLAVDLARRFNTRLHVLHLSTDKEMGLLSAAPLNEKQITSEVCVHHLYFDDSCYPEKGNRIKCNPAIKSADDRRALIQAVIDNRIDIIATDHAPHSLPEKQNTYLKAPAGLPLVQHSLPCLLQHYHRGRFTLELIAEKTAHAPARLFELGERGFIREGYWADIVLVNLQRKYVVDENEILYRCGWSPFEGDAFNSTVEATIVSGHLAYHKGRVDPRPAGKRLTFAR
jgi:dihydroorotase